MSKWWCQEGHVAKMAATVAENLHFTHECIRWSNAVMRSTKRCLVSCQHFDISGNEAVTSWSSGEPTQAAEMYRRAVENDVIEMWYYLQSQLTKLKNEIQASSDSLRNGNLDEFSLHSIGKHVDDVVGTGVDYKQYVYVFM